MTEERIITGVEVTSGEAPDGKQLKILVEKSKGNGIIIKEVIGDMAYVSKDNLEYCGDEIKLIAKSNPVIAGLAKPKIMDLNSIRMLELCNARQANWLCG